MWYIRDRQNCNLIHQTYETLDVNVFTRLFYFAIDRTLLITDFTIKRTPFSY